MPRRPRRSIGNHVFHTLNRAIQGSLLFDRSADYRGFLELLADAVERFHIHLFAYTLMPNHWHLVLRATEDGGLSDAMQWLCTVHAQRRRVSSGTRGRGAVYQGRFKAIAVQRDGHFLTLCRYVERNALRAKLVPRAEAWAWSSASASPTDGRRPVVVTWPVDKPADWQSILNEPERPRELSAVRCCIAAGTPFGTESWKQDTLGQLTWQTAGRRPGRPRRP
jgi:putative transposase